MRKSFRKNSRNKIMVVLIVLLAISLGYAAISTSLKFSGTITTQKQNWNIYWDNPVVTTGSKTTTPPTIGQDQNDPANTKVTWSTMLDMPGDFYEFTVDAVNNGTIDAAITDLNMVTSNLPDYVIYSISYDDGQDLEVGHILPKKSGNTPTVQKYKVRVEYDRAAATAESINNVGQNGDSYEFTISITYGLTDENSTAKGETEDANMIYAAYTGYRWDHHGCSDSDLSYNCTIGDTLLTNFATASEDATNKYFGGPTDDYRKLRLEYKRYKGILEYNQSVVGYDHNKFFLTSSGADIIVYDRKISYNPKLFYGFKIDNNRKIQKKYICLVYNGKKTCFEIVLDSGTEIMGETKNAIWKKLVKMYGEYDEDTHIGCQDNGNSMSCLSPDKTQYVEYLYDDDDSLISISIKDAKNKAYYCYGNNYGDYIVGPNDIENPATSQCYTSAFDY